jgi:hypothetical protein
MKQSVNLYKRHRFPSAINQHAVGLYASEAPGIARRSRHAGISSIQGLNTGTPARMYSGVSRDRIV